MKCDDHDFYKLVLLLLPLLLDALTLTGVPTERTMRGKPQKKMERVDEMTSRIKVYVALLEPITLLLASYHGDGSAATISSYLDHGYSWARLNVNFARGKRINR